MNKKHTYYPSYDVMALQDEWDAHTQEIVRKRLGPFPKAKYLNKAENEMLGIITEHLTYDNCKKIIAWVQHYIDQQLTSKIGESQRKPKVPPEKTLIRDGLAFLNYTCEDLFKKSFAQAKTQEQFQILADLQTGTLTPTKTTAKINWSKILQKALFNKLANLIISAYYSHPDTWSKIGYGGPAFPRGYVRVEFGLADPWEAKLETATPYGFGERSSEDEQ